jgi:hypothetical protein
LTNNKRNTLYSQALRLILFAVRNLARSQGLQYELKPSELLAGMKLIVSHGSHSSHLGQRFNLSPPLNIMLFSVILLPLPTLTIKNGLYGNALAILTLFLLTGLFRLLALIIPLHMASIDI